ncbi:MAG TPA: nuclear transport factor 2 family protein [Solirubrobacteraceae bacterium]|nr:nuclear transport factor 2 family protein [Solirubrobacteraceae bacterium]
MSQENVEVVRGLIAAINQTGEVVLRPLHPDVKWHLDSDHPDQTVLDGHDDVAAYFREWRDGFDRVRMDASAYIDRGEYVVMPFDAYGRLKGSAAEVPLAETWVFRVREGLIVEIREYLSLDEALKAVGREE